MDGADDTLHPRQQVSQPLFGRQAVGPDETGVAEIAEGADRCGYELVGDHPAADQTVVAVSEVVGGDRRARSHQIVDRVVEDPKAPP